MAENVVEVKNLKTYFFLDDGVLKAVDDVSFSIARKGVLGVIGESGCGKSVTAQSVMRIVPDPGKIVSGNILLYHNGNVQDIAQMGDNSETIRRIRGRVISMIFQEPMTSLSPVHSIGNQIIEVIRLHRTKNAEEQREICVDILAKVGIPNPNERIDYYPHQLSGGLRQRAMIAMALSCSPSLLIADEPTTALDVTVQAQILDLINSLQEEMGMSVMYITHDLGVIAEVASSVSVMYLGRVVESGNVRHIFKNPLHPYSSKLLMSIPKKGQKVRGKLAAIKGTVPMPLNLPVQCGFFSRCDRAMPGKCDKKQPALVEIEPGHSVRCFLYSDEEVVES
jgi:oligopeptide/dipeptide ABC transporter ATP-binding protein